MLAGDAGRSADRSRMPVPHVSVYQTQLHGLLPPPALARQSSSPEQTATSRLRSPTTSAAGSPLRQPRQTTSGPTRRTMAALTAPPSEYRPHNESPLAGFHRPVEGAFSVFRRFRVYGGAGAFFAFGWASTLPRHKGGVATRLRRRERCLRVAAALSFQKSHVSRAGTNSMIVPSGTGSHGSPSKALPCFVQMSADLLRRGSTST